ncbi:MAG: 30S ribosomal protein S20 [Anaeroplasmataceae bacterium]
MANIKQQIKRIKTNEKARQRNVAFKSSMKTAIKAVLVACEGNDKEQAVQNLTVAYKKLDKAQSKGIMHRNFVSRKKSELACKVNSL